MKFSLLILVSSAVISTAATYTPGPFDQFLQRRHLSNGSTLRVDLGYSIYHGFYNQASGLNQWSGIRYATAPIGKLRWQVPQPPPINRNQPIQATEIPDQCPQAGLKQPSGSEDCLYLSVFAPASGPKDLPVLVWIHGGGYGVGDGSQDLSTIINTNNGSFIGVSIQYRLGAFGFLSSDEVHRFGTPNAGLLDQQLALQWIQSYIHLFGGDPRRVTISGESAGAGSVMLHAMAYGGTLNTTLFSSIIAASPYIPMQYNYNDWYPSQAYYAFAQSAGCMSGNGYGNGSTIFECLVGKDTLTLQKASGSVSGSGGQSTLIFLPVTDGDFVQQLPSRQLHRKQVNGLKLLSGNNALEGAFFVPVGITTEDDLIQWIAQTFPLFIDSDISDLLIMYPGTNATDDPSASKFATSGTGSTTATNVSSIATGHQQRAINIYGETTFMCPSHWLAEAFSGKGHQAWKYQYSVVPALHGDDVFGYFGPATAVQGPDFLRAFMTIWGNFVTKDNPSISADIFAGHQSTAVSSKQSATYWPNYTDATPYMLNLNQTGGQEITALVLGGTRNVTQYVEPGLRNDITLVDAYTWEGGRGKRCEFWRSISEIVPE